MHSFTYCLQFLNKQGIELYDTHIYDSLCDKVPYGN